MRSWLLVAIAACGRLGFDSVAPGDGAGGSDVAGRPDVAACTALSPPDWLASPMPVDAAKHYAVSSDGTTVDDVVTGLHWQHDAAPGLYAPDQAAAYCAGLLLGGCSHWRLPQRIELATLVDHRFDAPVSGPPFDATPTDLPFVSASLDPNNGPSWVINFDNGNTFFSSSGQTFHVRCVHSDVLPRVPPARYQIGANRVLDVDTGLQWLDAYEPSSDTQAGGAAYCVSQRAAGGPMWRLPEIQELETLIDRSRQSPAIDPTAFPGTPSTVVWSSSLYGPAAAMVMDFTTGNIVNAPPSDAHDVRCVD